MKEENWFLPFTVIYLIARGYFYEGTWLKFMDAAVALVWAIIGVRKIVERKVESLRKA